MAVHACTIIARNYLAFARVLYASFIEHNPDGTLTVLIIDDRQKSISNSSEPFETLRIDEIGIDGPEILKMAAIYTVTELATAVKPWLLHTLIERWNEPVIYLDPDIMVFESLQHIQDLAGAHEIVITPHSAHPIPRDGKRISESEVLGAGIYNLGFIGVGVAGVRFLEFWKERLDRECISDPPSMRFVDQRWVDFAPAMFDAYILKDPTYNVAYWNLHAREFRADIARQQFLVDGMPIHFFHFSGYNPRVPELLSKYQGGRARILFSDQPDLKVICDQYAELLDKQGYDDVFKVEYGYAALESGLICDNYMRSIYREALFVAEEDDLPLPPNPFEGAEQFLAWINAPEKGEIISRYLKKIYALRSDLREVFPDAEDSGYPALLAWCWGEADKGKFDYRLIPSSTFSEGSFSELATEGAAGGSSSNGIQISGYFRAEMGVGELGRNTVKAVRASGISFSTFTVTDVVHRQNLDFQELMGEDHKVNIVCMNADSMVHFAYRMGGDYFRDRYTIAVWAWELEEFPPEFDESFALVDEIWACSEFARESIAGRGLRPVYALPLSIEEGHGIEEFHREDLGIPDRYMFLFCFDLLSIFERKNPLGLIDAFTSAFAPNEGPVLVVKALNGDKRLADMEKIRLRASGRSDIIIVDKYLDHGQNAALFAACDCYISLHRSEGLGLTIAEAMLLGKPVIATGYSGNMDFMNDKNSYLIPFAYSEVPKGNEPYPVGARWADPDISEAAKAMHHVYTHQDAASLVGDQARKDMLEKHSAQVASRFISDRFEHAISVLNARDKDQRSEDRTHGDSGVAMGEIGEVSARGEPNSPPPLISLASRPVEYMGRSRFQRLSDFARRVLRKMLFVRDNQQQEFNIALAMGTEHLARLWGEVQSDLQSFGDDRKQQAVALNQLNRVLHEQGATIGRLNTGLRDLEAKFDELDIASRELDAKPNLIAKPNRS